MARTRDNRRQRQVMTPEGVLLPFTLAARGARALALAIDLVLIVLAMVGLTFLMGYFVQSLRLGSAETGSAAVQGLVVGWIVFMFLFRYLWFLYFELGPRGATPGKRILGLRVAARDGGRLTSEAVVARNFMRDIELILPLMFVGRAIAYDGDPSLTAWAGVGWFLIFVLFPFTNRDGLRAGDLVAGTWVVEASRHKLQAALTTGAAAETGHSELTDIQYRFGEAELSVYGEYELQVLEQILRENRPEALADVAQAICAKIGWSSGRGDERAFLEAYYTQLRARLERGMRFGQRKADKFS